MVVVVVRLAAGIVLVCLLLSSPSACLTELNGKARGSMALILPGGDGGGGVGGYSYGALAVDRQGNGLKTGQEFVGYIQQLCADCVSNNNYCCTRCSDIEMICNPIHNKLMTIIYVRMERHCCRQYCLSGVAVGHQLNSPKPKG